MSTSANPQVVNEFSAVLTAIKIVVLAVFLVSVTRYVIVSNKDGGGNVTSVMQNETDVQVVINVTEYEEVKIKKIVVKQPACLRSELLEVLEEICNEFLIKQEYCTPEDVNDERKHKIPKRIARNHSNKDPKVPTIINFVVGALLMSSLGAAILEFYKAKRQPSKKDSKNSLSRKCSLADLTVMKHHRKELARKESLLEMPSEAGQKQLVLNSPPPLHRRCSFPIPLASGVQPLPQHVAVFDSRRQSIIIESRRTSLEMRGASMDGRQLSEQDSPERRHHGRLVYRH